MKLLNLAHHILAYDPVSGETNNPLKRFTDWTRRYNNLQVNKPQSDNICVAPGATKSLFSGVVATSIDGTTAFSIALLSGSSTSYRMTSTAGTSPNFRTARSIASDATSQISVTVNNNATATFTASGGTIADFSVVQVGDILRISGTSTGDSNGPFNDLNEGYWVVLAKTATTLTCKRQAGVDFSAAAESGIVLGASFATNFIVYSAAGVQIGNKVQISFGFSSVTQQTFTVTQVAPLFIEFVSTSSLPLETGIIPTATGMIFYSSLKRIVYIEADQECVIRVNGMTGNELRLSPFVAGDSDQVAVFHQIGSAYSLDIVNKSEINTLNVFYFIAE